MQLQVFENARTNWPSSCPTTKTNTPRSCSCSCCTKHKKQSKSKTRSLPTSRELSGASNPPSRIASQYHPDSLSSELELSSLGSESWPSEISTPKSLGLGEDFFVSKCCKMDGIHALLCCCLVYFVVKRWNYLIMPVDVFSAAPSNLPRNGDLRIYVFSRSLTCNYIYICFFFFFYKT